MCAPCNILLGHIFFFFAFLWLYQEIWFFCNLVDTIGICFFYENDFVSRSLECISQTLELTSQTLGYIFQTLQYKNAKQRNNCFLFEKEKKNKFSFCFLLTYSYLFASREGSLTMGAKCGFAIFRSKEQRKINFPLVLCSLIRTFFLRKK